MVNSYFYKSNAVQSYSAVEKSFVSSLGKSRRCARGLTIATTRHRETKSIFQERRFGSRKQITNARLRSGRRVSASSLSSSLSSSSQKVYRRVFALGDGCSTWMPARTASRGRSRRRRLFALHTKPRSRFFSALCYPRSSKLWARTAADGGNIKLQTT